jgi:hypothetical protein
MTSPKKKQSTHFWLKAKSILGLGVSSENEYDDRLLVLRLEKGDRVALIDRKERKLHPLELSRDKRGRFDMRELRDSESENDN